MAIAHGVKFLHFFWLAQQSNAIGPDYIDTYPDATMYQEMRTSLFQLGQFDDVVLHARHQSSAVALMYSETADIYFDSYSTGGAAKRT
eukprot:SAG22_NODE_9439_length_589_cov_1.279592_1_plen_87_part_10